MAGLPDNEVVFSDRRYGKNYVRLLHVQRDGSWHNIKELEVSTDLTLNDTRDYVFGDNSKIVATDSQKNTVYILAKKNGIKTIEEFGMQLAEHFLRQYNHVLSVRVYIEQKPWSRVKQGNREHAHAFIASGECTRFCHVEHTKHLDPKVSSGIKDMKVLKTTQSSFKNFVRDEYRALPDADDRNFCTVVYSKWDYEHTRGLDFDRAWLTVKNAVIDTFAGPPDTGVYSPSVQKTVYDTQKLALGKIPQMKKIQMVLPNVHAYQFDYSKFPAHGITKNDEVFQPTDKPSGNINATLQRKHKARL